MGRGDRLASGERSATFTFAPVKYDEKQMREDFRNLPAKVFIDKYLITQREYELMHADDEAVNTFAHEMEENAKLIERQMSTEDNQEITAQQRECIIEPCVPLGMQGRLIVSRDYPLVKKSQARLMIPRTMRREKTLLPTTGHVIKAVIYDAEGNNVSDQWLGKRILFGQMSGTAICMTGYPTWIQLDLAEVMAFVTREDVDVVEEELEPMV